MTAGPECLPGVLSGESPLGRPTQFFRVRLWDQNDLIEQLLNYYEKLPSVRALRVEDDDDLRAELPLKRIWTVATQDQQE